MALHSSARPIVLFRQLIYIRPTSWALNQLTFRFNSTANTEIREELIRSRKFMFLETKLAGCSSPDERPLVVLLPWILAKKKHVLKFANFYLQRGADVLFLPDDPSVSLRPKRSIAAVRDIRTVLSNLSSQPIIFHGFSVGCYLYSHFLKDLYSAANEGEAQCEALCRRIRGHIFDSPVDYMYIAEGVAKAAFPSNRLLRSVVWSTLEAYSKITYRWTTRHYKSVSEYIHFGIPTSCPPLLLLYSKADVVSPLASIERLSTIWSERGVKFDGFCFEESPHVMHMRLYPEQYISALSCYFNSLALPGWHSHSHSSSEAPHKEAKIGSG